MPDDYHKIFSPDTHPDIACPQAISELQTIITRLLPFAIALQETLARGKNIDDLHKQCSLDVARLHELRDTVRLYLKEIRLAHKNNPPKSFDNLTGLFSYEMTTPLTAIRNVLYLTNNAAYEKFDISQDQLLQLAPSLSANLNRILALSNGYKV